MKIKLDLTELNCIYVLLIISAPFLQCSKRISCRYPSVHCTECVRLRGIFILTSSFGENKLRRKRKLGAGGARRIYFGK